MQRQNRRIIVIANMLLDMMLILAAYGLSVFLRFFVMHGIMNDSMTQSFSLWLIFGYSVIVVILYWMAHLYVPVVYIALPTELMRVTLINLWATWCTPCVNELPYFDRLQQAHPDDVKVLAIHSDLITDDPLAYLAGFDYQMSFAVDEGGQVIASVGGSTMLPQTVVLNAHGEVIYNRVGSVTYEALEELVEKAQSAGESAAP